MEVYKFWDIIEMNWRTCRYISKDYDEDWETGRHRLIDDGENIFTSSLLKNE